MVIAASWFFRRSINDPSQVTDLPSFRTWGVKTVNNIVGNVRKFALPADSSSPESLRSSFWTPRKHVQNQRLGTQTLIHPGGGRTFSTAPRQGFHLGISQGRQGQNSGNLRLEACLTPARC
jgi:hypothetical protein